ncbi:MAG: 2-oxo acid dehydrogenase subunit E2, partial [Flavobacterium sp.]|nr:2-oxo acid dehydrogenase subunit E2 [Flavobacterium sp.]
PQHEGTVPQHVVTVPQREGTVPQHEGTVPQHVVTVPQREVTVPQREETVPQPVVEITAVEQKSIVGTPINQTYLQPVQQSVFVPTPVFQDIHLTTLAEGHTGKFANPKSALPTGDTEIIEMDRMRKLIAKHMVNSVQTSPHVTSFVEADVTNMVLWRNSVKDEFERREGTKITFTPMFIESIVKVMQQFPLINSSIEGDRIVVKKDFNIGMATALPSGNLVVPVIKSAEKLNIVGLSKAVNNLATAARNSQLKPDDTTVGTFTVTNIGTFGSLMGTPIINQPQVAILAIGAIKKKPVVIEREDGDTICIRHMMYLSLSYDHRVIDGSVGASFLTAVAKELEQWDVNRTWYQYV